MTLQNLTLTVSLSRALLHFLYYFRGPNGAIPFIHFWMVVDRATTMCAPPTHVRWAHAIHRSTPSSAIVLTYPNPVPSRIQIATESSLSHSSGARALPGRRRFKANLADQDSDFHTSRVMPTRLSMYTDPYPGASSAPPPPGDGATMPRS